MPEEKQLERDPFSGLEEGARKKMQERERQLKAQEFSNKIRELADKTIDFLVKYGEEDFRTQLMLSFLDVALEMEGVIEMFQSISVAIGCIYDAIGFIDMSLNFDTMLQEEALKHSYGMFARWKRRRRMRKTIRNNRNRMAAVVDNILGQQQIAQDIMGALRSSFDKMQSVMAQRDRKRMKKLAKQNEKKPVVAAPSKAQQLVRELMSERGLTPAASTETSFAGGSKSADGNGASSDVPSIDDIV